MGHVIIKPTVPTHAAASTSGTDYPRGVMGFVITGVKKRDIARRQVAHYRFSSATFPHLPEDGLILSSF